MTALVTKFNYIRRSLTTRRYYISYFVDLAMEFFPLDILNTINTAFYILAGQAFTSNLLLNKGENFLP